MTANELQAEFFSTLADPFTGERLYDSLTDAVFFIKNHHCQYIVVNQALVQRCGRRSKQELLGKRADEIFPPPLGENYRLQDERVVRRAEPIVNQVELHFYPTGARGWCLTNKFPLRGKGGHAVGLYGVSRDIQAATEKSSDYARLAEAIRVIHTAFDQPLRVEQLARKAGLSTYQFEQRTRRIFQLTPVQLIQKVRIEAALRYLETTEWSIAEVAVGCGYSDQSAFTRQFRSKTGVSPAEFRRTIGGGHGSR